MHGRIMTRSTARRWLGKILSYERVREERSKGKLLVVDLRDGYRASTCAILDASVPILGAVRT